MRCAKPRERLRDGGRIVNFSTSVVGVAGLKTYGVYAATKAAVEMLTAILAKELRGRRSPSTPWRRGRPRRTCS